MLGRKQELNLQFYQIVDGILSAIAFWSAHRLRFIGADWSIFDKPIGSFSEFEWLLFVIIPFGPILLELQGFYQNPLQKSPGKSLSQITRGAFWLGLLIAGSAYFLKLQVPSRAVMPLFAIIGTLMLMGREQCVVALWKRRAHSEALREPVVLAGTLEDIRQLRQSLTREELSELEVVAEFDVEHHSIANLVESLHEHSVSRVIFAGGHSNLIRLQEAIGACEIEGVEAWLMADFIRTSIARPAFDFFGVRPMLVFRTTPEISWALMVKGMLDRFLAIVGLVLASPVFLVIAIGIRLTSAGPVFFRQARGGKHGKPFTMYKFRSMRTDAEMRHAELAAFNQMSGPVFKLADDPRVTAFGKVLRRSSLDELPQLLNVIKGEMSLVGPRPLPVYEVERFESTAQRRRLSMKPGLTCLWQVSGRNNLQDFDQWVRLDLQYIDQWSLWMDAKILVRTIPVVLLGLGAR